ncbi:hypothetical protein FA15DRAFT_686963 [Coprinopsis marcescibilis]|uniref:EF-hand domain-containing protein n=1 Tax=Coprinopsis marcescibilis TaxID=230819 RepID=A0A5C3LB61_COPMA|nr:hypothetical protein FA15DRAFT_686963 [Coprinopsis marcescibilis]
MPSHVPEPLRLSRLDLDDELQPSEQWNIKPTKRPDSPDSSTSSQDSSDEGENFDWYKDDDETSKRKKHIQAQRGRRLWLAFMSLSRFIRVFLLALIGVSVLITPLVIVNVRFPDSSITLQVHVWSLWLTINWAAWCGTYLLVDSIPHLVIGLTSAVAISQVERLKIQIELFMAVRLYLKLALDITWAWVALSVIRAVYHPPLSYWSIINQLMQAFFAAGMILLVEKVALHYIAINFHRHALSDRLTENKRALRALDHLSNANPSPTRRTPYHKKGPKNSSAFDVWSKTDVGKSTDQLQGEEPRPRSKWSFSKRKKARHVANVIVDQVGEAIGQVALKNSKFNKDVVDFNGSYSARRLARKLFSVLSDVEPPRSHLIVEDFYPYFGSNVDAHEAFAIFDKDGNGDITKKEMREAVQRIYRERKAIVAGLKDVGSIVAKLDAVMLCVALTIILFICLLIFKKDNTLASLVPLATIVLGFSFIFGNSASTLFESLIFVFSTHVFDVGDLVIIDDQVLFVKEFGLFATTFRRVDGQEIIAPNSLLANEKLILNLRRSKSMWETTNLMVSYSTPIETIEQLRVKIGTYIDSNSREWSGFALNIDKMEYQNAIHLIVAIEHRANWQDWGARWTRRNAFMRYLKTVLEELHIHYTMPVQPVLLPSYNRQPPTSMSPPPAPHPTPDLGNAGVFQSTGFGRVGAPSFSTGVPSFANSQR